MALTFMATIALPPTQVVCVSKTDVAFALVCDSVVHARDLDVYDMVPVNNQLLDAHWHSCRE